MSNKETLQSNNTRLSINNTSLDDILTSINNLPEQSEVKLQDKEVTPTKETQTITSDVGYNGLNQVVVFGDNNLLADNIKDGVEIFGVIGNVKASASTPTIGVVFEEWDNNGYPITATIYGFTSVPKNAFKNVTGYTGTAKLKKITLVDATEIGEDCFSNLTNLININLPDNVTAIGSRAFSGCTKLSSLKTLPSLEIVKDDTFKECGIVQLSLPKCTKLSGASAQYCGFRYCNNFKAIWVGDKITDSELKAQAFSEVPNLKYIFINLPREKVEKFQYYSTKWSNGNIASDCQVICNDDSNWKTLEEFDAIDWSTM